MVERQRSWCDEKLRMDTIMRRVPFTEQLATLIADLEPAQDTFIEWVRKVDAVNRVLENGNLGLGYDVETQAA